MSESIDKSRALHYDDLGEYIASSSGKASYGSLKLHEANVCEMLMDSSQMTTGILSEPYLQIPSIKTMYNHTFS